jgi:hypothetical protein
MYTMKPKSRDIRNKWFSDTHSSPVYDVAEVWTSSHTQYEGIILQNLSLKRCKTSGQYKLASWHGTHLVLLNF